MYLYSPKLKAFFLESQKFKPSDCIPVSIEEYNEFTCYNFEEKVLSSDDSGRPVLIDKPRISDEEAIKNIRNRRNFLLAESDWTQLSDVPMTKDKKDKWKKYRQDLRDISDQDGYPHNVVFPEPPQ